MMDTANKGTIGVCAALFGVAVSKATIVFWLQMVSLLGGIGVTALTMISIWLSIQRKLRARKADREIEQKMKHKDSSNYEEETTTT